MRVNLLGQLTVSDGGEEKVPNQSPFAGVLLGRLAFTSGAVPRSDLRCVLWPDDHGQRPPSGTDDLLNSYVTAVRRLLGFVGMRETPVRSIPGGAIVLDRPGSADRKAKVKIETDLDDFRRKVKLETPASLRQALGLVRGPFLAGIDQEKFPWLGDARRKLEREYVGVAKRLTGRSEAELEATVRDFLSAPHGTLLDALPGVDPSLRKDGRNRAVDEGGERQGRSLRVLIGISLALLAIAALAFLVGLAARGGSSASGLNGSSPDGRAEALSDEMTTSPRYNLSAGLRVANRSYDDRWATHIRADPTDRLALALTLENEAPVTSYPLVLWTDYEQNPRVVGDYRVRLIVATPNGAVLLNSPWVYFHPWTNQFEDFQVEMGGRAVKARVSEPDGDLLRIVRGETGSIPYVTPVELRSPYQGWADYLPVERLASGQRVVIEFGASWRLPFKAEFGTIPPSFGIEGKTGPEAFNTGSVRVGDRVDFTALLDNQGTFAAQGHLRVDFRPRSGGRYIEMRLFGKLLEEEQLIGTATINSADGRPIELILQPGSTEVWSHPPGRWIHSPECISSSRSIEKPLKKRVLQDGIALGGIDIGDFGGFTPHGECAGTEFNEQLHFKATVVPR
jgi:hypothetical protein